MATPNPQTDPGPSGMLEFEWRPADLIRRRRPKHTSRPDVPQAGAGAQPDETDEQTPAEFALVVLNQPLHAHLGLVRRLWDNACVRVAADGGANCLYETAGVHGDPCFDNLDTIIGDLDSLSLETRRYYESRPPTSTSSSPRPASSSTTQILHVPEQESTDFAKAVSHVRHDDQQYPRGGGSNPLPLDIVALGGLGGRVDQGVSQLHHLFLFQAGDATYSRGRVFLFSGESLTWLLKPGLHRIRVRDAKRGDRRADNTANENDKGKNNNKNGPPPPLDSPRRPGNPPPPPPAPPHCRPCDTGPPRPATSADAAASPSRGRPGDAAADGGAEGGDDNEDKDGKDDDDTGDVFGKYVGILPVGGTSTITTRGLQWDVRAWVTEFGGRVSTSNHVLPETEVVEVETTREVLFTIALRGV